MLKKLRTEMITGNIVSGAMSKSDFNFGILSI